MYEFIHYQVKDVMTSEPLTVGEHTPLEVVDAIFEEHDFNGIPIVDANDRLMGMITKLDLLRAFAFTKRIVTSHYDTIMVQAASQFMTRKMHIFDPESPLPKVLYKMIETGHKSFPVVENERVVGIIAREDILRALRKAATGRLPTRLFSPGRDGFLEASNI